MTFSNKARLLLDFSRVFQYVSPCEIMWKIKQSFLYICPGYGSCHVRQTKGEEANTNDARRDFQDRLFSSRSGSNITELIFVTSYASY